MSKVYIFTQDYENYGSPDEPYWKPKGGSDYFIPNATESTMAELVESVRGDVECSNDFYISTILGSELVEDDYMTEFERSQLEYEGKINFPAKVLGV